MARHCLRQAEWELSAMARRRSGGVDANEMHGLTPPAELDAEFEVRRRQLLAEGDKSVAELSAEVGKPTARQRATATAVVKKVVARPHRKTG